jgi:methenyltetrahydrofolate cyclohydrolase
VLRGSVAVYVDGLAHDRAAGEALVVERGASRRFVAGTEGARVLTAHRRRPGLMPASSGASVELSSLLEALQAPAPSPAGGTAAAAVGAMAASLVQMVARGSPAWIDAAATAASASALQDRLLRLGAEDVEAFAGVLAAYRGGSDPDEALLGASRVPLAIAESSADVAELAAAAHANGKRPMRPDAAAAAMLAEAATRAAGQLVGVNLARVRAAAHDAERTRLLDSAAVAEARARAAWPTPA